MKKILVVDDEPAVLSMFKKFLSRKGYDVSTAPNAIEALRSCMREKPDLVLTDYKMPEMNGVDLLKELRLSIPDVPVILMSGQADMRTAAEALREHAFDFLSKPIDSNDLLNCIKLAMEHAQSPASSTEELQKSAGRVIGPFRVKTPENSSNVVVLAACRPLDQNTKHAYEGALRRLEQESELRSGIVLVLSGVHYINNIGLSVLLQAFEGWKAEGKRVVFANLSDPVHHYFKLLGYLSYFPMAHTVEEAVSMVS